NSQTKGSRETVGREMARLSRIEFDDQPEAALDNRYNRVYNRTTGTAIILKSSGGSNYGLRGHGLPGFGVRSSIVASVWRGIARWPDRFGSSSVARCTM